MSKFTEPLPAFAEHVIQLQKQKEKRMKSNKELYGTENVPQVPQEIANKRLELLRIRLHDLLSVHYMEQNTHLINEVQKAIKFWEALRDGDTI